jgi:hypothetical protein
MELRIDGISHEIDDPGELQGHFAHIHRLSFAEIWMQPAESWPTICALFNADAAWLMCLRFKGDAGVSARNPNDSGPPNAVIAYCLSNGQRDEYPASWDITTNEALRALTHFFLKKNGALAAMARKSVVKTDQVIRF